MDPVLVEKRNKLNERRGSFAAALADAANKEAGADRAYDDEKLEKSLGVPKAGLKDEIKKRRDEIDGLATDVEALASKERVGELDASMKHPAGGGSEDKGKAGVVSISEIGTAFVKSRAYANRKAYESDLARVEVKTLFQRTAGWSPESMRLPGYLPIAFRPIQILDFIQTFPTTQDTIKYMEETTRTNSAAEKAEGAAYAESAFVFTERSQTVEKVTDSVPVTDEQLEDVEAAEAYLNQALPANIRQRLDLQVLQGNGTTQNLLGILNKGSIQTQALGADPVFDAIYKALVKVRVTGRASPNAVMIHSTDWQDVVLTRTADGIYILGNPAGAPVDRLWGLPVVSNEVNTEATT